jgi:hypothetical protein
MAPHLSTAHPPIDPIFQHVFATNTPSLYVSFGATKNDSSTITKTIVASLETGTWSAGHQPERQ